MPLPAAEAPRPRVVREARFGIRDIAGAPGNEASATWGRHRSVSRRARRRAA
jgi:hypothetical protein